MPSGQNRRARLNPPTLKPGPKATLGPEYKINLGRPRDKTALNHNDEYKKLRNSIIEYLIQIGEQRASKKSNDYKLPDIKPRIKPAPFKRLSFR